MAPFPTSLKELCTPAMIYFVISFVSLAVVLLQNLGNNEIDDLKNFFYVTNNINPEILELKEFDLQNSKYFNGFSFKS